MAEFSDESAKMKSSLRIACNEQTRIDKHHTIVYYGKIPLLLFI
jgi:hypothetical protein